RALTIGCSPAASTWTITSPGAATGWGNSWYCGGLPQARRTAARIACSLRPRAGTAHRPAGWFSETNGARAQPSFVSPETTPLLGREAELRRLGQILSQGADGIGSVVLISGETGIGKTRVCEELLRASATLTACRLLGRAYPEESTPYAAVADAFRRAKRSEPRVWEAARGRAALLAQ